MKEALLVTIAIGGAKDFYMKYFVPSMKAYAAKFGWDFRIIDEILDKISGIPPNIELNHLTIKRVIQMQKLLILEQPWAAEYKYVIFFDGDILVNYQKAPNILEGIPEGKIGVVDERCIYGSKENAKTVWERMAPQCSSTAEGYYTEKGFPQRFPTQFNSGVLVFQPAHHREFCRTLYDKYMPIIWSGKDIDADQGVLNYEGNIAGNLHFLDERFNRLWILTYFLFYGFLNQQTDVYLLQQALKTVFETSYCVHFAAGVGWNLLAQGDGYSLFS